MFKPGRETRLKSRIWQMSDDGGGGAIFVACVADRDERWHSRRGMVTAAWVHPICDRFRTAKRWSPTRGNYFPLNGGR
ncbi:hypothetical protein CGCSCA4_v001276 [Colletotrichum siamense]|uniref:Uncharacterized protein n=1 Tax=Colletotrichum siamense TaxID=690259 RepID=A0A9P5F491_COLSI|nr:hypothetical protein CGCSCA4_v001276 [Colletotrichum siamense]KAF4865488.1 hypothetical protein CGCSCA2_v001697 [Colletotrichum siamense]